MSKTAYCRTALTGGTADSLDAIDGSLLLDGDFAFVLAANVFYMYLLDADSAAAESSPGIISPDNNAGDKRWINQIVYTLSTAYVAKSLFDAQTILAAVSDDTPVAVTITEQQVVGRLTGGNIKGLTVTELTALINAATDALKGAVELATSAESVTGTSATLADTPAGGQAKAEDERIRQCENFSETIQYPIPTSGNMLKAAADGSPATGSNTDTDVADAVTKKHTQNADTGTTATSFKINSSGNEADLQTTGLTGDRDYTLPDIDTMLAGAALMTHNTFEIIAY